MLANPLGGGGSSCCSTGPELRSGSGDGRSDSGRDRRCTSRIPVAVAVVRNV